MSNLFFGHNGNLLIKNKTCDVSKHFDWICCCRIIIKNKEIPRYIYIKTGSLNMVDVANMLPSMHESSTVLVAFMLCMIGIWIKMALFPLHVWLPNAYSYSPVAFSRVVAPLMTNDLLDIEPLVFSEEA